MLCDYRWDGRGEREVQDGGGVCIHMTDPLCCMAETNKHFEAIIPHFFFFYVLYMCSSQFLDIPPLKGRMSPTLPTLILGKLLIESANRGQ